MELNLNLNSFPAAMMNYFGKREGQGSLEFMNELKALSDSDKTELRLMLKAIGYKLP